MLFFSKLNFKGQNDYITYIWAERIFELENKNVMTTTNVYVFIYDFIYFEIFLNFIKAYQDSKRSGKQNIKF